MAQREMETLVLEVPTTSKWGARGKGLTRVARQKPLGAISFVILLFILLTAATSPWITPHDPLEPYAREQLQKPNAKFWLGSDGAGRDILSRLMYGARTSLFISFFATTLGVSGGVILGVVTGYFGKTVDMIGQRVVDSIIAIPGLVLALAIVAVLGQSVNNLIIAMFILIIPATSRIIRGQVMTTKENTYIEAARAIGCTNLRIMIKHVTPQVVAPAIIVASVLLGSVIIWESSLSFLGMGAPPPTPSWGRMLDTSTRGYMIQAPLITLWPGLAISMVVLSFNLFGDALRDVLDPRLRTG